MSLITNGLKLTNSGLQVGSNGTIAKDIRYIAINLTVNIIPNSNIFKTYSFDKTMPSIPLMFGRYSQLNGAAAQGIVIGFQSVSTTSYTMTLRNTSSFTAGNNIANGIIISIMAVSL